MNNQHHQTIAITVGVVAVFFGAALIQYYLKKKSNSTATKSHPKLLRMKTLQNSNDEIILPLIEIDKINHNTRRFRFALPSNQHVLGLSIGQHVHLIATINDESVRRSYTPISSDDDNGYVDLVIKIYFQNEHPKFPDGGKMSQYLEEMKIGDSIAFRAAVCRLHYLGNGKFTIKKFEDHPAKIVFTKKINMIAGGTGITPMLQLIKDILKHKHRDKTQIALLFANQSEDDIILRNELNELASNNMNQFKIWFTVDRPPEAWEYGKGFINEKMISEHLFAAKNDPLVLMCGPLPMINFACTPALDKLNFDIERRFTY